MRRAPGGGGGLGCYHCQGEKTCPSHHANTFQIIISSAHLNLFPSTFPSRDRIDWLPVDKLATILLDVLSTASSPPTSNSGTQVFHIVNPHASSWHADWAPAVTAALGVQTVEFAEWVSALRASADEALASGDIDLERNPAIRLLEFYEGTVVADSPRMLTSRKAEEASPALKAVGAVGEEWLRVWLGQWGLVKGGQGHGWMELL